MSDLPDFDEEFAGPGDWARMYRAAGLQVVPAYTPGEDPQFKRPKIDWREFHDTPAPDSAFERWYGQTGQFRTRDNMGIITGKASGNLLCVDLDVKEGNTAMQWWAAILAVHNHGMEPETVSQKTGGGGRQILFRAPAGYRPPTNKTAIGVDLRGQGGFMMCPPSMHESGKRYEWEAGRAPYETEIADAPEWLLEEVHDLILKHGGTAGGPRERTEASSEKNSFGLDVDGREEKLQRMVWARVVDLYREAPIKPSQTAQEAELKDLWGTYLRTTASRLPAREGVDKGDLLEMEGRGWSNLSRKWRYAMNKWDKEVREAASIAKEPVPFVEAVEGRAVEPVITEAEEEHPPQQMAGQPAFDPWERYVVPSFPMDTLPPLMQRYVDYLATSTGGDPAACAMSALAACSGALSQEFSLKMKRSGEWYVKPRLWVILVGDPSSKKSPVMSSCIKPIRSWEGVGVSSYQKELARWKEDKERQKEEPEPTRPTRYLLNESTPEKLGEILSRQDRGIMVEQDELSGWIGAMDKYGGGKGSAADRGFWLGAYNGGPRTVDRLSRGETFIQNLCVAFVGGIQPDRLKELGNLASDGLLQRFLPVMMRKASRAKEVESDTPKKDYELLIHELIKVPAHGLIMDEGALRAAEEFQDYIYDLEHMDGLGKSFCGFAGKLTGIQGSLALVLHMIEDPENSSIEPVPERIMRNAERILREFCIPHALELYRTTGDNADWDSLRKLASFILTSPKDRFTASDFTNGVHAMRGLTTWEVGQKVSPLVAGGWLVEDDSGKTTRAWNVVSGLREALSKRREEELRRKTEIVQELQKLKKGGGDQ